MLLSISPASRSPSDLSSTPSVGATVWIAANCGMPPGLPGSWRTATRDIPGMSSLSNSNHFALMPNSADVNPVALPPGRAKLSTNPSRNGIGDRNKHNRQCACCLLQSQYGRIGICEYYVWRKRGNFHCVFSDAISIRRPAVFEPRIAPDLPAKTLQTLQERSDPCLRFGIVCRQVHKHADAPDSARLLRTRRERPHSRRATEHRHELATLHHSITSSARASSVGGTVRPNALAVLRLRMNSNLVGCCTGRSPGLAPLRI